MRLPARSYDVVLLSGGTENASLFLVQNVVPVVPDNERLCYRHLSEACSRRLRELFGANNALDARHIQFITPQHVPYPENAEVSDQQQQQPELGAWVVPHGARHPSHLNTPVSLMEVATSPIPWCVVECRSDSAHSKDFAITIEEWQPTDVMQYLQQKLDGRMMARDPRTLYPPECRVMFEDGSNDAFLNHVGKVVALLAQKLGHRDLEFVKKSITDTAAGEPDFIFRLSVAGIEVMPGEGKTPDVMGSAIQIKVDCPKHMRCAGQEAFYIHHRERQYGWLTYYHGSFFFKRIAERHYAITRAIYWKETAPGVIGYLLYILLHQLEVLENPAAAAAYGVWVPQPAGPQAQQQQQQQQQPPSQQQQLDQPQRSPRLAARPGSSSNLPQSHSQHLQQQWVSEGSHGASFTIDGYLCFGEEALQLTDRILGYTQSGVVKQGKFAGAECAVKMADDCNQRGIVAAMKREVAMYEKLTELQGSVIPRMIGAGYWRDGFIFFIAIELIHDAERPSYKTKAAQPAAEKALDKLHEKGILHGDLSESNLLLQKVKGNYKAWLIDLGASHGAEDVDDFSREKANLLSLFRPSRTDSEATDMP